MVDPLNTEERSERMSKVHSKGNKSTEGKVEQKLIEAQIQGWVKHPKDVLGKPDFFFPEAKLAVFVDGCFWHGCPVCNRRMPVNRAEFWRDKIDTNRRRDNRTHRKLRNSGFRVMRIWEHELKHDAWVKRLQAMLRQGQKQLLRTDK